MNRGAGAGGNGVKSGWERRFCGIWVYPRSNLTSTPGSFVGLSGFGIEISRTQPPDG
jgi:hypothetical protein